MVARERTTRFTLPRRNRIRRRADFVRAYERGARAATALLTVWILPNDLDQARLGVSVTRRHGNSVRRNRLRRIVREAFRRVRGGLPPGLDAIVVPRVGAELALSACMEQLEDAIGRAARFVSRADRGRSH